MGNNPVNGVDPTGGLFENICGNLLGFTIEGLSLNLTSISLKVSRPVDPPKNPNIRPKFKSGNRANLLIFLILLTNR